MHITKPDGTCSFSPSVPCFTPIDHQPRADFQDIGCKVILCISLHMVTSSSFSLHMSQLLLILYAFQLLVSGPLSDYKLIEDVQLTHSRCSVTAYCLQEWLVSQSSAIKMPDRTKFVNFHTQMCTVRL